MEVENSEDTTLQINVHQKAPTQTSNSQCQQRQEDHVKSNETTYPHLNGNIQFNDEYENSVSIDHVPETPQHRNSLQMSLGA